MLVLPRRNDQFARPGRGPGPELCDINEDNDPPEPKPPHGPQVKASLQTVKLCMHGLVLIDPLFVTVLIKSAVL